MKVKTAIATASILSVLSFGAFAADLVNADQAQNRQSVGVVSVDLNGGSPTDLRAALNEKANEQGASAYRVIEAREGGNWHATAELYK